MAGETLTVLSHNATYNGGYVFINLITQEECVLTLLITHLKPTRRRNPNIQEDQMKTHRWIFTMRECREIQDVVTTPNTVHNFEFRFPELNDTIYYSAVYRDLPRPESPQAPIFAARIPLALTYQQLWPGQELPIGWNGFGNPAYGGLTVNNGRLALRSRAGVGQQATAFINTLNLEPNVVMQHAPAFVLYDTTYQPTNTDVFSLYFIQMRFYLPNTDDIREATIYGDINDDPCNIIATGFLGNFQPHEPHLFALDLYVLPDLDLCGQPLATDPDAYLTTLQLLLNNQGPGAPAAPSAIGVRPFALYQATGPMQDISRRWWSITPLLPQKSSPKLTQQALPRIP